MVTRKEMRMKTDHQLKQDVTDELGWDPAVKADAVGVSVKDGVVTLTGHIDTYAEKHAIEKALRRVGGVKAIALELDVKLSPDHHRSDTDIARAIEQVLAWNTLVSADKVQVTVERGWVTLRGELNWDYQRRSVEKLVRPLFGVVGVSNELTLKPTVTPSNVAAGIEQALKRQAEREARRVQIIVDGATVTLRGRVNSWQERDAAAGAAWSAPGVRSVINEVQVGI
jgi:osmotically-inducible protein OsmY